MAGVKFQKEFTLARSVGSIFITRKKISTEEIAAKIRTVKSHIESKVNSRHVIKE